MYYRRLAVRGWLLMVGESDSIGVWWVAVGRLSYSVDVGNVPPVFQSLGVAYYSCTGRAHNIPQSISHLELALLAPMVAPQPINIKIQRLCS